MGSNNDDRFWIKNIKFLFNSTNLIPKGDDSLETQVNSLTRLVLILFVVLFCIDPKYDLIFLVLSLIFLIIIYYVITNKKMTRENFQCNDKCNSDYVHITNNCDSIKFNPPQSSINNWKNGGESYYAKQSLDYRKRVCEANGCGVDVNNYDHCVSYDQPVYPKPPEVVPSNLNKTYQHSDIGSTMYKKYENTILNDIGSSQLNSYSIIDAYNEEEEMLKSRQDNYKKINIIYNPGDGKRKEESAVILYEDVDSDLNPGYVIKTQDNQEFFVKKDDPTIRLEIKPEYTVLDESILKFENAENKYVNDCFIGCGNIEKCDDCVDFKTKEQGQIKDNENTERRLRSYIRNFKHKIRELKEKINKCDYVIKHNKGNEQKIKQAENLKEECRQSINNTKQIINDKEELIRQIEDYRPGGPSKSICPNLKEIKILGSSDITPNNFTSQCQAKNGKEICYIDPKKLNQVLDPCRKNPPQSKCDIKSNYGQESDCVSGNGKSLQENFKIKSQSQSQSNQFKMSVPNLTVRNKIGTDNFTTDGKNILNTMYQDNANPNYNSLNLDSDILNNPNYVSNNQLLAGNPNPKTEKATIIVPPIDDMSNWKPTDFVNHSLINKKTNYDLGRSGYLIQDDCNQKFKQLQNKSDMKKNISDIMNSRSIESFQSIKLGHAIISKKNSDLINEPTPQVENFNGGISGNISCDSIDDKIENINNLHLIDDKSQFLPENDTVNTSIGYFPENIKTNLPVNMPADINVQHPVFDDYNKQLSSNIIQPGVYNSTQVLQPINSNLGICYPQQLIPYHKNVEENGDVTYEYLDPFLPENAEKLKPKCETKHIIDTSNVYDPRSNGYGTSYRSYIDKMTGQVRYYYDDINAIRQPNYITRNNLDTFDFGTSYGPMTKDEFIGNSGERVRTKADDKFLHDTTDFRNDLQQNFMRNNVSRQFQLKRAPLRN